MKYTCMFMLCGVFMFGCSSRSADWQKAADDFRTMPLSVRPNPLWFWNNAEVKPAELKQQMSDYRDAGYGGLSILPFGKRFRPEYLSETYFDVYGACVKEAAELGLRLWIYDEYGFPSGTAGDVNGDGIGRFRLRYPEHAYKRLDKTEYRTLTGETFEQTLPAAEILMAVVAMDSVTRERIDLAAFVERGKLRWTSPGARWKVMVFTCADAGISIVDYLSPEAAQLFIGMTHEEYYRRFGEYFGTTVAGTFFDEPTLYYGEGRAWTPEFNRKFEAKHGFVPTLWYPALWYDIGGETAEARNSLFGFRSELYAAGYPKAVSDWSLAHGVRATGHQDNEEIINCVGTSGDLMKCFKYQDIPGIDKIGGNRPAERFYKIISSAAYNWDHSIVMSETYGAMGNISPDEMFAVAMDQYSKGINFLIPHAVWYDTAQVAFLPELSLRNPLYADSLRVFTDYLSRLNAVLHNDGRGVCDLAVLYPVHTMQAAHFFDGPLGYYRGGVEIPDLDYVDVGAALFDSLGYDFMFLHPETLDERCRVTDDGLLLDNPTQFNTFSTLILPACRVISLSNLEKIRDFVDSGGTLAFTTLTPKQAVRAADDDKVAAVVQELLKHPGVVFVENPEPAALKAALAQFDDRRGLRFTGNESLRHIRKQWNGKHLWFFANPDASPRSVEVELRGEYRTETWNPHTGETGGALDARTENGKTRFRLNLGAIKSVFVVEK